MNSMRKLIDLLEAPPVIIPDDDDKPERQPRSLSKDSLYREFDYLDEIDVQPFGGVTIFLSKSGHSASGVLSYSLWDSHDRVVEIFVVTFKDPIEFTGNTAYKIPARFKNPKQVEDVFVAQNYRARLISSKVYKLLADTGIDIFSDVQLRKAGSKLWTRIGKDYSTFIVDISTGTVYTEKYHGEERDFDKIWSTHPDYSKHSIVLVLSTR